MVFVLRLVEGVVPGVVLGSAPFTTRLRVIGQLGHIGGGVSPLEMRRRSGVLLLSLPEEVLAQGLGELGGEHVASRGSRRQRERVERRVDPADGLGARNLVVAGGGRAERRLAGRIIAATENGRRLRGDVGKLRGTVGLVEHRGQQGAAGRDQARPAFHALEQCVIVITGRAALGRGFPLEVVVVDGALRDFIVVRIVVVVVVERSGGDFVPEGGPLVVALLEGAVRVVRAAVGRGRRRKEEERLLLLLCRCRIRGLGWQRRGGKAGRRSIRRGYPAGREASNGAVGALDFGAVIAAL